MTLWWIRATVDDRPGYLSVLTASLALRSVNILSVQVHTTENGAVDEFLVDAPDALTEEDLVAAVHRGRGRDCWVVRSRPSQLADQPTRVLGLAERLVRDPERSGEVLRLLLGADEVCWRPAGAPERPDIGGTTLWLADPTGGSFVVRRVAPTFTPAEYARAQALLELAGALVRRTQEQVNLLLPDGTQCVVRPATVEDLPFVAALHEGCSADRRRRRCPGGGAPGPSNAQLRRLIAPGQGLTLLAVAGAGQQVVAMANLTGAGPQAEAALLVRDDWQRRGLGTALLRRLVTHAEQAGYVSVVVRTRADDAAMLRTLRRLGWPEPLRREKATVIATVPLAAPVGRI